MREARHAAPLREPAAQARTEFAPARQDVREPDSTPRAMNCPVEDIAQAYLATTHGDAAIALRCAITDALSDLLEAERRARENSRLISRGYVRQGAGPW